MPAPAPHLTVRPLAFGYRLRQSDGIEWMKAALQRAAPAAGLAPREVDRALRYYDMLSHRSQIERRVTAPEDYTHRDWGRMAVHGGTAGGDGRPADDGGAPWYRAPLGRRMALFADTAEAIALDAFAGDVEAPDAIVQVSCTGYDSPSAVQRVVAAPRLGRAGRAWSASATWAATRRSPRSP